VMNDKETLWNWLQQHAYASSNIVLMSSGNYDGLDMLTFATRITS
jgi:UDP-N-acetylmuramate: L-alanyl-gamma-D-glutamyl-meso-diaminopimelate ligase